MEDIVNMIYNESCISKDNCNMGGLQRIPTGSVDFVLTDPPYNIARDNNFTTMGRAGIDFGEWDKDADILSYIDELNRVTSKNGGVIIFNAWKNLGMIADRLEHNGFVVKDCLRWIKTNPMPRNRDRRYITDYEMAVWAVKKGSKWVFNRQSDTYQRPEFKHSIVTGKNRIHPTQKPVALLEELIKIHTNEGNLILDPFMGSGSTAEACIITNRKYVGFERDEAYYQASMKRLSAYRQ